MVTTIQKGEVFYREKKILITKVRKNHGKTLNKDKKVKSQGNENSF